MAQAQQGDTVRVHYIGTLEDGTKFDSSRERETLQFTIGGSEVIPGFEEAVLGMEPGDTKSITIPCVNAYGVYEEDRVAVVDLDQFPEDFTPDVGQSIQLTQDNGEKVVVTITDISGSEVTLDANHPLADEALTFEIELMEIV